MLTTIDNFSPTSTVNFAGCISTYPKSSGATTVPARANDTDLSPSTRVSGPLTMWGQPIQVAFQSEDLSLYTTSTAAPTSQSSSQTSSNSITHAFATSTPISAPSNGNGNGLSNGAKTGIGIGVAGVALFVLGIVIFLLWKRRQKSSPQQHNLMGTFTESKDNGIPNREATAQSEPVEMEALPSEMPVHHSAPLAEMDSREARPPVEQS